MSEHNKDIVRRFLEEAWNKGNVGAMDELFIRDVVVHGFPLQTPGLEGFKEGARMYKVAFPDGHAVIEDVLAEGDKVVTRWTYTGTHKGEMMGIPPTGKRVTFTGIIIDRIAGGKIAEHWVEFDMLGVLQQLGVVPQPGQSGR